MDMAFWFVSLACLGALYVATICARPLAYLALCLRRPKDLHSYGSWAIVTGPTSGLGRSMAMELARRGFNLVLLDLDAGNLLETTDAIKALHSVKIKTVVFDLSLVATPQGDEAMGRLREAMDGLDVGLLVNNAAVNTPGAVYLHEADIERFVRMIRVNLWGLTEGDGGGAAADAGAGEGRHRERRLGVHGGRPVLPSLHRLQLHEKVRCHFLQKSLRRVQEQRNRRPIPGSLLRAHAHAVERREGQAPAVVRGDGGRVHAHGGAVDRERPAVRARRCSEAAVVPHRLRSGLGARLVPDPPAPAAQSCHPGRAVRQP